MFAFSFALLLSLLPAAANIYGLDELTGGCWYRGAGQQYILIWEWTTFFGWMDASILYCAIVIIMIIRKLNLVAKQFDTLDFSSTSRSSSHLPLISKARISSVVRRVMWYPVLPVAQIFGGFTQTYYHINHEIPYVVLLICFIGLSLQGLLNALVFSQDIAVTLSQPSLLEWLRYMLLIKIFSFPKTTSRVNPSNNLSSINSSVGNKLSAPSVLVEKDNSDKQNVVQGSSIELTEKISEEIVTTLRRL
ncbi:9855_t:CDS:2 [Cetraspora pellucida]|uniref:9855_t:CDS:1 n=1 Tax=Cetraspora pellucida TaxID=1433469 RepID=A0A9N9FSG8_9GLOM|nr:9855_t:CDS:2 [Cetraspora pellucida]